jgi:hypothetical protein
LKSRDEIERGLLSAVQLFQDWVAIIEGNTIDVARRFESRSGNSSADHLPEKVPLSEDSYRRKHFSCHRLSSDIRHPIPGKFGNFLWFIP